jgi:AraC-like DNA-binding protein
MEAHVDYCPTVDPNDLLSEVLQDLRLARASYGRSELTAPWGIEIPYKEGIRFHFVAEGSCCMLSGTQKPIALEAGDLVLLPHGTVHVIADQPSRRPKSLAEVGPRLVGNATYRLTSGGGGARSLIVCCTIGFDGPTAHPLIELLPEVMLVRRSEMQDPALPVLLDLMATEVASQRIGAATIMARLADIVVTRVIRAWVETRPSDLTGWLAAIRDPQIGLALARIHRSPGEPWSVDSLAQVTGLGRSIFTERFTALLGVSPARYVLQWRMRLAAAWLRNEQMTVAEVATLLGYESDASFSRAFKRFIGVAPSAFRPRMANVAVP